MNRAPARNLTLLIKPASSACNLQCQYCFYEDLSNHRQIKNKGMMNEETIRKILYSAKEMIQDKGFLQILFQGGEPTLAGLPFFKRFLEIEQELGLFETQIAHSIQTNGILLDEKWAQFFSDHHFLVGISIDGTSECHDLYRIDSNKNGTWDQVVSKINLFRQFPIELNLCCVIHHEASLAAQNIYKSLCQFHDLPLQFIPCLDPLDQNKKPFSLHPQDYGQFLCEIFDMWYADLEKGIYRSVRFIDDYLRIIMGLTPTNCALLGHCGSYIVVEADGSLYPCDFYVLDEWYLGNIRNISFQEALASAIHQEFIQQGQLHLDECRSCPYLKYCQGGCKRDRINQKTIYCEAYQQFLSYALPRLYTAVRYLTSHQQ